MAKPEISLPNGRRNQEGKTESDEWRRAMGQQRRIKQKLTTFEQRLIEEARQFKEAAEQELPGSLARELLLRRARQAETAIHVNEWLASPGLQPPKLP